MKRGIKKLIVRAACYVIAWWCRPRPHQPTFLNSFATESCIAPFDEKETKMLMAVVRNLQHTMHPAACSLGGF